MAGNFGAGVEDVNLAATDEPSTGFTHTRYWDAWQSEARLAAVRTAVNLRDL